MPKTLTPQQKRDRALLGIVARAMAEQEIRSCQELADQLKIARSTFANYRQSAFAGMRLSDFGTMARALNFTGRDLCAAFGVPYADPEERR